MEVEIPDGFADQVDALEVLPAWQTKQEKEIKS
jgi:hypothetical protein